MIKPLRSRRSFLAALAFCTASASALFAAEPSLDRLVPAETSLVLALRDMPALRVRYADTSFGRAWADPEIARFFAPLSEHPKLKEYLAGVRERTGLNPEELAEFFTGDVVIAVPALNFSKESETPAVLLGVEVGEKQTKLAELLTAEEARATESANVTTEDYNGVELHLIEIINKDAEPGTGVEPKHLAWALHQGRWFVGSDRATVVAALDALAAGGLSRSLAESPDYLRLVDRARGKPEMLALFNFGAIYPALLASVEAQRDPKASPNMFGLDPATVMRALGLDAIEGISVVTSHSDDTDYMSMALNYSENRGLVRLLAYQDGPVAKPDWMPATWFNVSSQNFSVADFYTELEVLLGRINPLLAGMAQGQVKSFERKLSIDLKRDLFGSLGTSFVSGFAEPSGASGDKATPYDELDQFIGVSLADAAVFERTLDAIKGAFLPAGEASPLQSREYLGRTIYSMNSPVPGAKGFCYAISDGWLLVGIGSPGTIESAIQLQATPTTDLSFWRRADVRAATDGIPAGAISQQYTELSPLFASLASFLVKYQEANGDENERFVDASALPSRELLSRYFKYGVGHIVRTTHGLFINSEGPSK